MRKMTFLEKQDVIAQLCNVIDERSKIADKFVRLLEEQPGVNDRLKRQKRADA